MTTKKLPYLDDTGLWKMYLKYLTMDELKRLGYYKIHPHSMVDHEYQVPKDDIIKYHEAGYTKKRISMLLKVSPLTVELTIKNWKGGDK